MIFAWELANEPQIVLGDNGRKIVRTWIEESARVIKDLDPNHLVTTGAEGKNGKDWFLEMHECSDIGMKIMYGGGGGNDIFNCTTEVYREPPEEKLTLE